MQMDEGSFRAMVEPYRRELRAHCYRMSGSLHDADDLVQESMLRAWRGIGGFEQRASLRTWLHRVTTHACIDALESKAMRRLAQDEGSPSDPDQPPVMAGEIPWMEPCPDELADTTTPESRIGARESITLAFLTALQRLPAKQRAVLLLRDVLGHEASECASLLDTSVASVNSALQRARDTLATAPTTPVTLDDEATRVLLRRYVSAWEEADVGAFVSLLREDATLAMPPYASWYRGRDAIGTAMRNVVLGPHMRGVHRLLPTRANGCPALAMYSRDPESGASKPSVLHVLAIEAGAITTVDAFVDGSLFVLFGLPASL